MKQKYNRQKFYNMKDFHARDIMVVQQMMHQIHLTSEGFIFKI